MYDTDKQGRDMYNASKAARQSKEGSASTRLNINQVMLWICYTATGIGFALSLIAAPLTLIMGHGWSIASGWGILGVFVIIISISLLDKFER